MIPLIGVLTRGRDDKRLYSVNAEYLDAIRRGGGEPVLLPHGATDPTVVIRAVGAVVLIGGSDVDPALYKGRTDHPEVQGVDVERDRTELAIVHYAAGKKIPVFGICRGMQVVNVALGGNLHEHLPDEYGEGVLHRENPTTAVEHEIEIEAGSKLEKILGVKRCSVRSHHHQSVRRTAPGLRVSAKCADGVIEAMEHPDHPWFISVQWHPELNAATDPVQQRLFDALVAAARGEK